MLHHASFTTRKSSFLLGGREFFTEKSTSCQRYSIGLRLNNWASHHKLSKSWSSIHCFTDLAECLGSLSYCKIYRGSTNMVFAASSMASSRMNRYWCWSITLSTSCHGLLFASVQINLALIGQAVGASLSLTLMNICHFRVFAPFMPRHLYAQLYSTVFSNKR